MTKYRFFSDSGHGWLEVPRKELDSLGIGLRISGYSYQSENGRMVYLEEDCDLTTYLRAIGYDNDNRGFWDRSVTEHHTDGTSFIRDMPDYQPSFPDTDFSRILKETLPEGHVLI